MYILQLTPRSQITNVDTDHISYPYCILNVHVTVSHENVYRVQLKTTACPIHKTSTLLGMVTTLPLRYLQKTKKSNGQNNPKCTNHT